MKSYDKINLLGGLNEFRNKANYACATYRDTVLGTKVVKEVNFTGIGNGGAWGYAGLLIFSGGKDGGLYLFYLTDTNTISVTAIKSHPNVTSIDVDPETNCLRITASGYIVFKIITNATYFV